MTEGSIGRQIIKFAVPLFLGNLFQQLYNTADTLIVGRLLGSGALTGCAFFALGIVLAAVYDRKVARRQNPGYTITGFADKKF